MDNLLQFIKFNRIVLFSTLCAFTLNVVSVSHVYGEGINVGLNDINFAVRIEKLIEKIHRYANRLDQVKTIETLLDIKHEIEGYVGKKIDIDKELEGIEKEIKKMGGKFKKGELKEISKLIKKKEKKHNHKSMYMSQCMEYGFDYAIFDEPMLFKITHDEESEGTGMSVPVRVTVGVTVALCGAFLFCVPIPICQVWSPRIIAVGCGIAFEGVMNRVEQDEEENKQRK